MSKIDLYHGDCLEVMDELVKKGVKVDAIITDIPYGTTACSWDVVIPFDEMWDRITKLSNPTTPILLFGNEPFSSALRLSNIKNYKYDIYWQKEKPINLFLMKKRFGKVVENICVFYKKQCTYNPQMTIYTGKDKSNIPKASIGELCGGKKGIPYVDNGTRYPLQVLKINRDNLLARLHPTQKPLELMEYLVKTFTNEGDTVLDFTMGSGTTGVACKNLNRNFIGIELDENYYKIAKERIYGKEEERGS